MGYRILADENVHRQVCRYLEKQGHDAVMVVDELAPGVDDLEVVEHARATDRIVLTHDTDYFEHDYPTLFIEQRELSAYQIATIVDTISEQVSRQELAEVGSMKVVEGWL